MGSTQRFFCASLGAAMTALGLLVTASMPGCSTASAPQVGSSDQCMGSCRRASNDGSACLAWSALAPEHCTRRYSLAQACCGPGDQAECELSTAMPQGAPCVCRGADPRGAFVVQGSACRPR